MVGHLRQRRPQRHRLEFGALAVAAERLEIRLLLAGRRAVGNEEEIKLAALRRAGELAVMGNVEAGIGLGVGMPPRGDMMTGRLHEGAELELTNGHGSSDL